jgi:hypothetical protein
MRPRKRQPTCRPIPIPIPIPICVTSMCHEHPLSPRALSLSPLTCPTHPRHSQITAGDVAEGCALLRAGAGAGAQGGGEGAGGGGSTHPGLAAWLRPAGGASGGSSSVGGGGGSAGGAEALLHAVAEAVLRRALGGALRPGGAALATGGGGGNASSGSGSSGGVSGSSGGLSLQRTWACSVREVADVLRAAAAAAGAAAAPADGGSGSGGDASRVVAWVDVREAVEVKNHCPFAFKGQRKASHCCTSYSYSLPANCTLASLAPLTCSLHMHQGLPGAMPVIGFPDEGFPDSSAFPPKSV